MRAAFHTVPAGTAPLSLLWPLSTAWVGKQKKYNIQIELIIIDVSFQVNEFYKTGIKKRFNLPKFKKLT